MSCRNRRICASGSHPRVKVGRPTPPCCIHRNRWPRLCPGPPPEVRRRGFAFRPACRVAFEGMLAAARLDRSQVARHGRQPHSRDMNSRRTTSVLWPARMANSATGLLAGSPAETTAGIRGASTTEHAIARQSLGQRKRTAAVSQRNRHRQPTVTGRKRVRTKLQPSAGRDAAESRLRRRSHTAEHHALEEVSGTTACQGSYSGTPAIVEHPTPFSIGHLGPVRPRDAVSARKTVGPDPRAAWRLPQCKRHTCRPKTRGSQGGAEFDERFQSLFAARTT